MTSSIAGPETSQASSQQSKAAFRRAIECFNDPDRRDGYFELYAAEVALHGYPPDIPQGIDGAKRHYANFWKAFPDARFQIDDLVAEGDRLACRYSLTGTHKGEFMGMPASGNRVTITGLTLLRFEGGKCVERWRALDELLLLQQVDAIPT